MKQHIRILGIDDSPFNFDDKKALVIGALVRVPNYLEGVVKSEVTVDGTDSTETVIKMISESRFKEQIKLVMVDGIALAGFNVIDIDKVHSETGIPVLTVTRDEPDLGKIKVALEKYFEDWRDRYHLITKMKLHTISTEHKPLYACGAGMDWGEFEQIVQLSTVRGAVPEPLRIAHLIASAMVRGESYGRS
jgi:endonuclease V-like protein UPF0215 family